MKGHSYRNYHHIMYVLNMKLFIIYPHWNHLFLLNYLWSTADYVMILTFLSMIIYSLIQLDDLDTQSKVNIYVSLLHPSDKDILPLYSKQNSNLVYIFNNLLVLICKQIIDWLLTNVIFCLYLYYTSIFSICQYIFYFFWSYLII